MSLAADLASHRYLSLATFRVSGAEVRTPVWFAETGGKLYVFTASDSGKVKRLRRSSRVRVAPCDGRGRIRGDWREGVARVVDAVPPAAQDALRAKYGWQKRLLDLLSRLSGRIHRRAWIEIDG